MIQALDKLLSSNGIAHFRCGCGPVLLLIHGVGLRGESWSPLISSLSKDYELIVIDLPGHGESEGLDTNFDTVSFEDYYSAIEAFIDSLSLQHFFVCGHSLGALLAIQLAARQGPRVIGLVALNSVYQRSDSATEAVQQRAENLSNSEVVTGVAQTIDRWFTPSPDPLMVPYARACEHWLRSNTVQGYAMAYKTFASQRGPSRVSLDQINCATIYMTGELDGNSSPAMSQRLCKETKSSKVEVINGAGHMLPLTHSQAVVHALVNMKQGVAEKQATLKSLQINSRQQL